MPAVTLSDVAREAGVSLATASRAINGSAGRTVRPELRDKVLEAAARLHYSPDANAQAMARGRTTTLGLIVHDIADPYFSSIAAGVGAAAERAGLVVTLATTQHDPGKERQLVGILQRQRARAIVLAGGRYDDPDALDAVRQALREFRATGGTVALVGQPLLEVDTVSVANERGSGELARALHGRGYRRFGLLGGPDRHYTARERRTGFTAAAAALEAPVAADRSLETAFTRDGGYEGMRRLLADGPPVDAVFAVNDVMAVGAMAAVRDAGLTVGADVAVAGFDDIVTLRDVTPGLTTVRLPLLDLGRRATDLALTALPGAEPRVVEVDGEVVLRDSTPAR
jgi:LacI family transcriptional regulator